VIIAGGRKRSNDQSKAVEQKIEKTLKSVLPGSVEIFNDVIIERRYRKSIEEPSKKTDRKNFFCLCLVAAGFPFFAYSFPPW